jgi:chemotaxis protein CheD
VNVVVGVSDMVISNNPEATLVTYSLGSCIGLALHDRQHKVGGLAHIVLPSSRGNTDRDGKCVDTAIPALIRRMEKLAGSKLSLTAKMAGGASMFSTTVAARIGLQNIESCERMLGDLGIPIVARHCGGEQGRRMSLDTANGKVTIEIVGKDPIEL